MATEPGARGPFLLPAPLFLAARLGFAALILAESGGLLLRWREARLPAPRVVLVIAIAELLGALLLVPPRTARVGATAVAASYLAAALVHAAHGRPWLPLLFVPLAMAVFLAARR